MKFIQDLFEKLLFILPIILVTVGIILNSYAGINFLSQKYPNFSTIPTIFPQPTTTPTPTPTLSINLPSSTPISTTPSVKPKFGHFPYPEANSEQLMIIASYATGEEYQRFESLVSEAALALMKLIYAARDDGIWIVPVSGFRTKDDQAKLFQKQIEKRGSPEAAAKLSAPPGYSEHHTGYAIDFTDGNFAKQKIYDITYEFANSQAFKWLTEHAQEFGFELSFPENNPQGVSYEPWHWRFVGSPNAKKIFRNEKS